MELKARNRVKAEGSMSSMTDLVFLLLIFFIILSTMISPNGEPVDLPSSDNKVNGQPTTSLTITPDLRYQVNDKFIEKDQVETTLKQVLSKELEPKIALRVDKTVPTGNTIEMLSMARKNDWKIVVATQTE